MKLTSRGDYATRIVLELSTVEGSEPVSVHELAIRTAISEKYLEQIMLGLRTAHIVRSERGVNGGYALTRRPKHLTVGEVVRAMDGPFAPSPCASRTAHVPCPVYRCPSEESCVLRGLWMEVRDAISGVLDRTTFAELTERQRATAGARGDRYAI